MQILLDETYTINLLELSSDLWRDDLHFMDIGQDGELHVLNGDLIEVWQAREVGCGANNTFWGDAPNGYEFCRSFDAKGVAKRKDYLAVFGALSSNI